MVSMEISPPFSNFEPPVSQYKGNYSSALGTTLKAKNISLTYWRTKSKGTDFIDALNESPFLLDLIKYDKKFNNKRKVEFESSLAGVIRSSPRMLQLPVIKTARAIAPDLMFSFEKAITSVGSDDTQDKLHQLMYRFFSESPSVMAEYTGKYGHELSKDTATMRKFIEWINTILHSNDPKDFHRQLLLIGEYGKFFLRPYDYLPECKNLKKYQGPPIMPEGLGQEIDKIEMKRLIDPVRNAVDSSSPITHSRIRVVQPKPQVTNLSGIFDSESRYETKYIKKYCPNVASHLPGKNVFVVTTSDFTHGVRFGLDMPLIASQGSSIALLLIPAIAKAKLDKEELRLFNLSALSFMISNGHHALHEFKLTWNVLGIPYNDGCYNSIFPKTVIDNHPELSELLMEFRDLMPAVDPDILQFAALELRPARQIAQCHARPRPIANIP
jgi:hypothetical protein